MIAYKGFTKDLTCTCGSGVYQYTPGVTVKEKDSKTRHSGFHYSEYPPECFAWYPINGQNRYFLVEASGSIDEENSNVSTCTEMTLKQELSVRQMALHTIAYILHHPRRTWEAHGTNLDIAKDAAECMRGPGIAIARGQNPKVRGCAGTRNKADRISTKRRDCSRTNTTSIEVYKEVLPDDYQPEPEVITRKETELWKEARKSTTRLFNTLAENEWSPYYYALIKEMCLEAENLKVILKNIFEMMENENEERDPE